MVDSQRLRNLLIPEIDTYLNRAQEVVINSAVHEYNKNETDKLRTLTVSVGNLQAEGDTIPYPADYRQYLSLSGYFLRGDCRKKIRLYHAQHDDLHEENLYTRSDFDWEEVNFTITDAGFKVESPIDASLYKADLIYVRNPAYIHYAAQHSPDGYSFFGTVLTGQQDCELPIKFHQNIVDLAAQAAISDLRISEK